MKDNTELVIYNRPKSNVSEDIRTIRTNLQFTSSDEESKVILITSSIPGEGKSFISSNLATAFALNNETTLLIDSDLRLALTAGIREVLNHQPEVFDPRTYLKPAREYVKQLVKHKIVDVLGSNDKL